MIVFELMCSLGHRFESWFQTGAAFDRQQAAGVVACPLCGSTEVTKAPMAPRIARSGGSAQEPENSSGPADGERHPLPPGEAGAERLMNALQELRRHVEANCDYVGHAFPEEARRIHYGEAPARGIYGEASPEEAAALKDEGVEARRVPWLPRRDD